MRWAAAAGQSSTPTFTAAHADVDKKNCDKQAQRDKWRERLSVFALERARPAPESKTHHHKAGNPTDEIPGRVHLRPEQQPGKQ